jgi:2-iminobutanoate/2-iminopropanoate deaminase
VISARIYLTDLANFQLLNRIYEEALEGAKPARATIQVSGLPRGSLVEIELIAEIKR